ncbi:MAG: ATP-binding protein [Pseudanabaenaceae cyanobacterium bins.39]|nr:ATP-binding protein [Pseudanabaenaceae cyanobacterium bins.39]
MTYSFQQATKENIKLRMVLYGPPGCGKTYTALQIATILGKKVGLIDTEYGSSRKYAKLFNFQVLELSKFGPSQYYNAIESAEESGFDYLVIDSLSHAWYAELDAVGSDVRNWAKVRPIERQLWDKIISSRCHIIATMRSKIEYDYGITEVNGKQKITSVRKIGTAPIQKEGSEYELDICGLLDDQNTLTISKSRCPEISNGIFPKPGKKFAELIQTWLSDDTPTPRQEFIPVINVPVSPVAPQPQVQELATVASRNGHTTELASTNGHLATVGDTKPIANTQPKTQTDNPAKAAFKALLAVTQQPISKVIETSIELYGADASGTKPKFNSENMTATQIKDVCEALIRDWLGQKGFNAELVQSLLETSTTTYPGQYAEIAKDIANQVEF